MEHLDTFLGQHPPFDGIDAAELPALVAGAHELAYATGEPVLVEDGPPAPGLWVILTGSMDLLHEGEAIQVLEPGECFGHPSLLTGMAPAFSVRAREPSTCVLLSPQAGRRVLGTPAGAAYVALTMRKRLTRTGHTVHGLLDVSTTPVSAIMRPPSFCGADEPLREAARRLGEDSVSALLVDLGAGELAILTDAEVRAAVAEDPGSLEAPLRAVARNPVPKVPIAELAVEATVEMVAAGSQHVVVLDGDQVCGVVSAAELLGLDARAPIALRHRILAADDEDALVTVAEQLPKLFLLLMRAGVPPREIGRVLTLQHDAVVARLVDFSIWRHGPAPLAWAWLDLGSTARREFTLASDQDNAFAYADPPSGSEAEADAYFARLGAEVNDGLARCGIGVDNNGVMAGKRLWRMSKSAWLRTFDECLRVPDESHLIRATVAFDFRPTAGGLAIASELTERMRASPQHPDFMRLLGRTASGFPVALGFRGQLAAGKEGDPEGKLDLKRGAIIPLVNLVRFHAIANGVMISPTLDRIHAVAAVGGIDQEQAGALAEAFELIIRLRFEHHAALIATDAGVENDIDLGQLPPIARQDLREALHVVRRAQRQLGVFTRAGK